MCKFWPSGCTFLSSLTSGMNEVHGTSPNRAYTTIWKQLARVAVCRPGELQVEIAVTSFRVGVGEPGKACNPQSNRTVG